MDPANETVSSEPPYGPEAAAIDLDQHLREATPTVWVTPVVIVANVGVFIAMVASGVGFMEPSIPDLLTWGANFRPYTAAGEWWRLLTSTFIHIGAIHLAFNMAVLGQAGPFVERLLGNVGFLVMYVVSGLGGSLLSAFWHADIVSAGASGSVFGVYGALMAFVMFRSTAIPKEALAGIGKGAAVFIGFNLLYSFRPGVDMAGHLGGLAAGALLGFVLPSALEKRNGRLARQLATAVAGVALCAGGAAALPETADSQAVLTEVSEIEDRVIGKWNRTVQQVQAGELTDPALAAIIEDELLPDWRRGRAAIEGLIHAGSSNDKLPILLEYMEARQTGWETIVKALGAGDPEGVTEGMAHHDRAEQLLQQLTVSDPDA